jgi:hypothetical protein
MNSDARHRVQASKPALGDSIQVEFGPSNGYDGTAFAALACAWRVER